MAGKTGFFVRSSVLAVVALSATLAGCGGGSSGTDDASGSGTPTSQSVGESTTTTSKSKTIELTPESVAQALVDAGIGCADYKLKATDTGSTPMTLAPKPPMSEATCSADGIDLEIGVFETKDAEEMFVAQVKTVYAMMFKAFGISDVTYVQAGKDNRIYVSVVLKNGVRPEGLSEEQQTALQKKIAAALDGKVVTIDF